ALMADPVPTRASSSCSDDSLARGIITVALMASWAGEPEKRSGPINATITPANDCLCGQRSGIRSHRVGDFSSRCYLFTPTPSFLLDASGLTIGRQRQLPNLSFGRR